MVTSCCTFAKGHKQELFWLKASGKCILLNIRKTSVISKPVSIADGSVRSVTAAFCVCFFPTVKGPDKPVTVVYVPSHLYHMVFELFKVFSLLN